MYGMVCMYSKGSDKSNSNSEWRRAMEMKPQPGWDHDVTAFRIGMMDGCVDVWMDGCMDGWMDGWMYVCMDGCV